MVNLWFTEKDLRYRWSEVKQIFWEEWDDQLRLLGRRLLEESLRVERSVGIGAGPYERSDRRRDQSNGYYSRDVICKLGVLSKVLVPRSRHGVYRSQILERYRRFGGDFDRQILKTFTLGLATRRVEEFFTGFFGECGFSSQTVSNILKTVSYELGQYHSRTLSDDIRYLYLDGFRVTIRSAFRRKYTVLFALAEYADGRLEVIDFRAVPSEKGIYWQAFLDDLYRRGLKGSALKLVVTDGALGLIEAVRMVYGFAPLQVCWIHRQRNLVKHLRHRSHRKEICDNATAIFKAGSRNKALLAIRRFQQKWLPIEPRAVKIFIQDIDLSLTFYDQPKRLWSRLASNNIIERFHREIRRRVRLIDSFRDEHSCERIIYTQVAEFNRKQELSP